MLENEISIFLQPYIENEVKDIFENIDIRLKKLGIRQHRLENPIYPSIKFFSYILDKEFTDEQKKWFVEKQCYKALGYFPNLDNPVTFNEKTNYYKLHYKDPLITKCIDKYLFKDYVASTVGKMYIVPLINVYDKPSEIDFDSLPEKFVIKSNWGSGSRHVVLVHDKKSLKYDELKMKLSTWIQPWENVYYHTFDWGYKDITPKIIVEKLIEKKGFEYKFFCFYGEPKFCYVANDSSPGLKNLRDFYTIPDWEFLPVKRHCPNFPEHIPKPAIMSELIEVARKLSAPFPHVRVDMVETPEGLLAEELTFYTGSGQGAFTPTEWDTKLGEYFDISKMNIAK